MDVALNKQQRLILHKTQTNKHFTKSKQKPFSCQTLLFEIELSIYIYIYIYKWVSALNNLKWLICHKTKPN